MSAPAPELRTYQPTRPHAAAAGLMTLWIAILSLPMLSGRWLVSPYSDQLAAGYAFRTWDAAQWKLLGHAPLWNPMLFGGLPFVAAGHGDIFYPTSFLRLVLPTETVMNLGFVLHYLLAGFLVYVLLRLLGTSWGSALTGGLAYQLSGPLLSYPNPGHDGKLFVSAMLPLTLIALVLALRDRRWVGYPLLALAVGLSLLSPHYQMTYYELIVAGLFALYLTFGEPTTEPPGPRIARLAGGAGAVLLGFGMAMIQILPFVAYLPFSPRALGYRGFEGATSYAIPWEHIPEFFLAGFTGQGATYWGSNPLKLHSEYLGLAVVALAILGIRSHRRRLVLWLGGIALLFLLVALGADTPFYRVWWTLMPYVKQTRAPGMAFYAVGFVSAILAAFGVERIEHGDGKGHWTGWTVIAALVALLAVAGVFGNIAVGFAAEHGRPAPPTDAIRWGALGSALALAALAAVVWAQARRLIDARAVALLVPLVVGADLWRDGRHFWHYDTSPRQGSYRSDAMLDRIREASPPYRVLQPPYPLGADVYPQSALMAYSIPQVLGYHGNELHAYDELLGGKDDWHYWSATHLWRLLAVRFVVLPESLAIPGYHRTLGPVRTAMGQLGYLYEADTVPPYARVVPAAVKGDSDRIVATLVDPRLDYNRLVLFSPEEPVNPLPLDSMPPPSPSKATVTKWEPGRMTVSLNPAPPAPSYVLVSENWYPDWHAAVDGASVMPLRGDETFLTVAVPAGAKTVELWFDSPAYARGKLITLAACIILAGLVLVPAVAGLRRRA